jgi:GT2 family glycosyltransferase
VAAGKHDWIACTDAGCTPEPGWLRALDTAASEDTALVAGIFVVAPGTAFERAAAVAHYPDQDEIDNQDWLVSASHRLFGRAYSRTLACGRSMAFSRAAWSAVGGFPEMHYTGEDLAFSRSVIAGGGSVAFAPDARVTWRPRTGWVSTGKMFFTYCRGDVRRDRGTRHIVRLLAWTVVPTALVRGRLVLRAAAAAAIAADVALPIRRARRHRLPVSEVWRVPLVIALKDLAQLIGAGAGIIDRVRGREQPLA